ncbi:hypothetical protein GCM10010330_67110 [Streptomyces tendae]|nr:hypothetical protein GCM10010330_67110 [Streptomyces tendae]
MQSTTVGIDDITALGALADELGLVLFDAPVSGTRAPAEAGQLLILAAGPEKHRPSVTPVLDAVGARTVWTGEDAAAGTSTRLKLVVNSWVIAASVAAGEIVSLAQRLGVDPRSFFDLIAGGGLDMPFLQAKAGLILNNGLAPAQFAAGTAAKDARLIVEAGAHATAYASTWSPQAPNAWSAPPRGATPPRSWPPRTTPASTSSRPPDRSRTVRRRFSPRPRRPRRHPGPGRGAGPDRDRWR